MTIRFNGVHAALTTPFVEGRVSPDRLRDNLGRYNRFGLAGYVILGSTGESVLLSDDESAELVRTVREAAAPGKAVIAGTARESTRATIDFTRRMADLGVDAVLVRTPGYYRSRMDSEALRLHFTAVAEASPVPVILYNIPQNTGVALDSRTVIELARHPNVAGLKDSSGNLAAVSEVAPQAGAGFDFLLGAGSLFLAGLLLGAAGAILAVADAVPELCVEVYDLFRKGRTEEARRVQEALLPLNRAVVTEHGVPGLKYALDRRGLFGGLPRPPLQPVSDRGRAEIDSILEKMGISSL
jgi:4-hydroxy-2-oxoglutarate aldolase